MKRRAFVLVMCLILAIFFFVVGLAFLGQKASQYRTATAAGLALQAKALAEAGYEDFRLKMQRDWEFPPYPASGGTYSYKENLVAGGVVRGSYTVTVNATYHDSPYSILVVTSTGEVGDAATSAVARRAVRFEVDISPKLRSDATSANPDYRHILNYQDLGGL